MSDEIPLWRQAIHDSTHPLNRAAWLLFSTDWSAKLADRLPAENREQIIEFCYRLLDAEELYLPQALGSGHAPGNALRLLGHWQMVEAMPRMIEKLGEGIDAPVYAGALDALTEMGTVVLEPVMAYAVALKKDDLAVKIDLSGVMARAGKGDERAFEFIRRLFESLPPETYALDVLAEDMLHCYPERAVPYLEKCLSLNKYKRQRTEFQRLLGRAQKGES